MSTNMPVLECRPLTQSGFRPINREFCAERFSLVRHLRNHLCIAWRIQHIRNQIRQLFGFNFAPTGWAFCNGQLLPISQNTALFSLLGTMYGGNGQTTFALPDLRGRAPLAFGQGPGLADRDQGEVGGVETVTLTAATLAPHGLTVGASSAATTKNPSDAVPSVTASGSAYGTTTDLVMSPSMIGGGGSGQPHENMPPYLVLNWCIALEGIFPSRD